MLVGLGEDLSEVRALIESAGYRLAREFVQRRTRPDARLFVGKGKLADLKAVVRESAVDAAVFAGTLRPSQHYELEKALKVQCFDRLRVILEIFTQRAHSREARLQVELAMLQYEVPILREWIHSATVGERPGFMAGGEYRVDAYYETVKRKMRKIRDELAAVRAERQLRRNHRQQRGFYSVSVAGYANAGKSSVFNALSGERVLVDGRLFTSLSTTTRALEGVKRRILVTDTVGFVRDVPLWLVEAFQSTFEEVHASDLVLLLVDVSDSDDDILAKVQLAADILLPGVAVDRILPVITKADLVGSDRIERCVATFRASEFARPPLVVSVRTGEGLNRLRDVIVQEFQYPIEVTVRVFQGDGAGAFLSWLHEETDVISTTPGGQDVELRLRCRDRDLPRIRTGARIVAGPTATT